MNSRVAIVALLLIVSLAATAQTDTTLVRPSWFMTVHGGALFARRAIDTAPSIIITQGMRYKRFALGVGVACDTYTHWRTLPVFTGLSYDFVQGSAHAIYLQADVGYSRGWYRSQQDVEPEYPNTGGYFYHPAIGYRGGTGRLQIHISAGYKIQNIEVYSSGGWWGHGGSQQITVLQRLERLSFLIGIGLR